jgi:hypothetical protein
MDESTKLLVDLSRREPPPSNHEPLRYDVRSLLEEGRNRIYTNDGQRLVAACRETDSTSK